MLELVTFEFGESRCFEGSYSWRLKAGELRYRGTESFAKQITGRIPVSDQQLERFVAALDLLEVWRWREDYKPSDAGREVSDGGTWWFKAAIDQRICNAAGKNAFPSFEDSQVTLLNPERFGLLSAALYQIFSIDWHIEHPRRSAENEKKIAEQLGE